MPKEYVIVTYKRDTPVKQATVSEPMFDEQEATAKADEIFQAANNSPFSRMNDCVLVAEVVMRMERDYDPR